MTTKRKVETIPCPLCTTPVKATRSGHIQSHLNPGGVRCHAVGMNYKQGIVLRKSIDKGE